MLSIDSHAAALVISSGFFGKLLISSAGSGHEHGQGQLLDTYSQYFYPYMNMARASSLIHTAYIPIYT